MIKNNIVPFEPKSLRKSPNLSIDKLSPVKVFTSQMLQDTVIPSTASTEKKPTRMRVERDITHEHMEAVHIAVEVAETLNVSGVIAGVASLGTIASGVFFSIEGIKDLKTAIKEKKVMEGVESAGHLALGGEALLETVNFANRIALISNKAGPAGFEFVESATFSRMGTTFGFIHGGAEIIVGGKEYLDGKKQNDKKKMLSGALNMGIGASILGIAMGGGMPCGFALGALFLTKMILTKQEFFQFLLLTKK